MRFHLWGAATCLAILAGQAGHAADLTQGLAARIATLEQDPAQNAFELGAMRVLRGVETGLQTMNAVQVETLVPLPLLRLAPGGAGKPPPQPGFVNALFSRFATDLDTARADLTLIDPAARGALLSVAPGIGTDPAAYGADARRCLTRPEAAILTHRP